MIEGLYERCTNYRKYMLAQRRPVTHLYFSWNSRVHPPLLDQNAPRLWLYLCVGHASPVRWLTALDHRAELDTLATTLVER